MTAWPQFTFDDGDWVEKRQHRAMWLAPFLNVESLADEFSALLRLLDVRSRYDPQRWTEHDEKVSYLALEKGLVAQSFNALGTR